MLKNNNRINHLIEIAAKVLEVAFLALTGIYLMYLMLGTTTFYLPYPAWFDKALLRSMAVLAALRLLLLGPKRWEPWASVGMAVVYYMVFRSTGYRFLVYLGVLTAGLSGIDYRKILKTYLYTLGTIFFVTVLAALSGAITNFVYTETGKGIRSSWGFCYPTDFASIALFLLLMLWVAWRKLPDWAMLIPCIASVLMARYIAISDTSTICSLLFAAMILYHIVEKYIIDKRDHLRWIRNGSNLLLTLVFPICAIGMFVLMLIYNKSLPLGIRMDNLLSGRLRLGVEAWQKHGIRAFGVPFDQVGNGFSTVANANYNFIDSSYPLILIRYGWVLLLTYALAWGWTIRRAIKCGDKRLALVMGLIAFHSFAEHHFIEVNYNILLVMPFAAYTRTELTQTKGTCKENHRWLPMLCTTAAVVSMLSLGLRKLIPWLKTILQAKRMCGGGMNGWLVICANAGILAIAVVACRAFFKIIQTAAGRTPTKQCEIDIVALVVCICTAYGAMAYGQNAIIEATVLYSEIVEADRQALEIVQAAATCPVYSDVLPEVYRRANVGISESVFSGEEHSRRRASTVLMDTEEEHSALINCGFLYSKVSDRHAIYTSDIAVANALKQKGYSVTGFYSEIKDVDLAYEAWLNNLDYSTDTGLCLDGPLQSLTMGPYVNLNNGSYSVTYDLQLSDGSDRDANSVCNLRVCSTWGENTLAERWIEASQFSEDGTLSITLPFSVWMGQGIEFLAFDEDTAPVQVKRIYWGRTPEYDVHTVYDDKLRTIRQEYYTLDGQPTITADGYYACEKGYDSSENVNEVRYYDSANCPVINSLGYARVCRAYNENNKIIKQEYFGINGEAISISDGYAIEEIDYNQYGDATEYRYYDDQSHLTQNAEGYAILQCSYDQDRYLIGERFLDADYQAASLGNVGYSQVKYEYNASHELLLVYCLDDNGYQLQAGSAYFHEFLQALLGKDYTVFISIKDEGTYSLTKTLLDDLKQLGMQTSLKGRLWNSYCAVISPYGSTEEISAAEPVSIVGFIGDSQYSMASASFMLGNYSTICIDGVEYSKNVRGMNIVVYDNEKNEVIDTVGFDTYDKIMTTTR